MMSIDIMKELRDRKDPGVGFPHPKEIYVDGKRVQSYSSGYRSDCNWMRIVLEGPGQAVTGRKERELYFDQAFLGQWELVYDTVSFLCKAKTREIRSVHADFHLAAISCRDEVDLTPELTQ